MAKLFDSMAKLKFKEDGDGKPTKEAVGMYSKDGEYVDFDEPCKCVGQVYIYVHIRIVTSFSGVYYSCIENNEDSL